LIDIRLQLSDELITKRDAKVNRLIHDLKNPVSAILQILNDHNLNYAQAKEITFVELEDLNDMLDNTSAEFKSWHLMDVDEPKRELDSMEFIKGLKHTHARQSKNRNNHLRVSTESFFPKKLWVQRLNLKRVANNLISNAIKHTSEGYIDISIRLEKVKIDHFNADDLVVGSNPCDGKDYITLEIKDNGSGITNQNLKNIFSSERDMRVQTENQDLINLGLPNCKYICKKSDSFIRYFSIEGKVTIFKY